MQSCEFGGVSDDFWTHDVVAFSCWLYPQWMSVTSWENEKEGRPPLRCYMVNISIATVLALTMVLQAVISPNSPPVTSILLFATILSAICYYICLGIVQIAYAAKPPSPRLGEVTSWKRSMGILRGVVLVVMNVAVIGAELALDPVFRTGAVVLSCIMALSCLYYFAYSKKTIVPVQF
ncbi:hypothetical protein BC829DRAFT_269317 [Chytridium lagenaria]|nr:hypothetical protein BC829DRAFT_269317 [Chytridium lagenaria]